MPWSPTRVVGTLVVGGLIAGSAWVMAGWRTEAPPPSDVAADSSSTTATASEATSTTTTTAPPPTTTTELPLPGPVRLLPTSRFDLRGVGPIEAGMTVHEAEQASGVRLALTPIQATTGRCSTAAGLDGLQFVVLAGGGPTSTDPKAGTITRSTATAPSFATVSGAHVGSTLADARALYAGRYDELRFGKAGVALTIKGRSGADRDFGVRIESTDGQKVTSISSGHLAALAAPDGCA